MDNSYTEIKKLTDEGYRSGIFPAETVFLSLLQKYKMELRDRNNLLMQINYSVAKSKEAIVIGLRYKKLKHLDDYSEDYAVFCPGRPMLKCYGKMIEKVLPEYRGRHKALPT